MKSEGLNKNDMLSPTDKTTAIIVDDEKNSREVLASLLEKFCPEVEVIGETYSADTAYQLIQDKNPDLVFLDIQMPTGNGFGLLQKFNPVPFSVIFVTSYDQYAINAIKFSALDYLLKPVDVNELKNAVNKAVQHKKQRQVKIINLLHNLEENEQNKIITVHLQGSVKLVNSSDVVHIEADGPYSHLYTDKGEKYTTAKTLKEFELFFGEHNSFVRISKSIMINVKYVQEYTKKEPCMITLSNKMMFEASRRKKQEVMEKLRRE